MITLDITLNSSLTLKNVKCLHMKRRKSCLELKQHTEVQEFNVRTVKSVVNTRVFYTPKLKL